MKNKMILLSLLLIFLIFISGCWDYSEYESIAQVIGIAVDFDNKTKQTTTTHQYLFPKSSRGADSSGGASGKMGTVYSATGNTLYEGLSKLQQVVVKRIFYGYLKVLVIGEEAARYNLLDQVELMDRTPLIRDTAYFVVCSGKAAKVLSTVDENSMMPSSQLIFNLVNTSRLTGVAFPVTIHDVAEILAISGWEVTIPRIISTAPDASKSIVSGTQNNIRLDEKYKGGFRLAGMAAFKGDKFAGWLDEKETLGFGWITGKPVRSYQVSVKPAGTDPSEVIYFRIAKSKSKIKPKLVDHEPMISVEVSVTSDVRKYFSGKGSDYLTPEELKHMEKLLTDSIRSDIKAALIRGQTELKSDIFGFGFAFFREYPHEWQNEYEKMWTQIYSDVPVEVKVKAKIVNTGSNIRKFVVK